jgi:HEAT repeat protein
VNCRLDDLTLLRHLVFALTDPNSRECPGKLVRIDAARAISQLGAPEGALILRLKALLGDPEPEVIGQCFTSLLSLEPSEAVGFLTQFLTPDNPSRSSQDTQLEAACALAQSDQPEALAVVKHYWGRWTVLEFKRAVLLSLGASPLRAAADFLLSLLSEAPAQLAADAIAVLAASRYRSEVRDQAAHIVSGRNDPALSEIFEKEFTDDR